MKGLPILNTTIRRDNAGRFCINDAHRASGGQERHEPANWLRLDTTTELVQAVFNSADVQNKNLAGGDTEIGKLIGRLFGPEAEAPVHSTPGRYGGTYVAKPLLYAYAMWINAEFHLAVIQAFDAMVTGAYAQHSPGLSASRDRAMGRAAKLLDQLVSAKTPDQRRSLHEGTANDSGVYHLLQAVAGQLDQAIAQLEALTGTRQ
jgi:hypothetical protein